MAAAGDDRLSTGFATVRTYLNGTRGFTGLGANFLFFSFFSESENHLLVSLQDVTLDTVQHVLKDRDVGIIDGVRASRLSHEELAEAVSKVLRWAVRETNRAGRDALLRVLDARGRGLSEDEYKQACDQLQRWKQFQTDWAREFFDGWAAGDDGSEPHDSFQQKWRIEEAVAGSIYDAIASLSAIKEFNRHSEPPENLSYSEAAELLAEVADIMPDRSRIGREIREERIKLTEDGRITTLAVVRRGLELFRKKAKARGATPNLDKHCPQCGAATHKLIGTAKVCHTCFARAYGNL